MKPARGRGSLSPLWRAHLRPRADAVRLEGAALRPMGQPLAEG